MPVPRRRAQVRKLRPGLRRPPGRVRTPCTAPSRTPPSRSSGYQSASGTWNSHALYHADGGGNITYLIPSTYTNTPTKYVYDAYGRTVSATGPLASANVYRFSSKELHAPSGLYYYGYRFYDPLTQRWINRDPLGEAGGMNLYGFVGNGPIASVDPLGLHGNVVSSTIPGFSGVWSTDAFGSGSPGILPGDFFSPLPQPPFPSSASEIADRLDRRVSGVSKTLVSSSVPCNFALNMTGDLVHGTIDLLRFGEGIAEGGLEGWGADSRRLGGILLLAAPAARLASTAKYGAPATANQALTTAKTTGCASDEVVRLFHQGSLKGGKVSDIRPLSTSPSSDLLHYRPQGQLLEFHVPRSVLNKWEQQGLVIRLRDLHAPSGIITLEFRILPPASGQMNQFLIRPPRG